MCVVWSGKGLLFGPSMCMCLHNDNDSPIEAFSDSQRQKQAQKNPQVSPRIHFTAHHDGKALYQNAKQTIFIYAICIYYMHCMYTVYVHCMLSILNCNNISLHTYTSESLIQGSSPTR